MKADVGTTFEDAASLHKMISLRRDVPQPLYVQIEDQIIALMSRQRLPAGSTLPPERQLAEALGVSRTTVQNGYNALRARKLLSGEGRRGSVVQPLENAGLTPTMDRLKGFTQEMKEMGRVPTTRVLESDVRADRSIASLFGLHSSSEFLRLVRVRYGDDIPMTIESAWYSLAAARQIADADPYGSMYQQLSDAGLHLSHCDQSVEATMASAEESAIFGFEEPRPCLLIKRRSYVHEGPMVEYVEGLFRGDCYAYRLRLNI